MMWCNVNDMSDVGMVADGLAQAKPAVASATCEEEVKYVVVQRQECLRPQVLNWKHARTDLTYLGTRCLDARTRPAWQPRPSTWCNCSIGTGKGRARERGVVKAPN